CRVIIICTNIQTVKTYLTSKNVDFSSNVEFVTGTYNTVWLRDYGPNPVYLKGVDSLALVDWIYNRPRPLDDKIPDLIGSYMNLPVFSTSAAPYDLVNTGGNYMSDGMGTAFASKLVLDENGPNNKYGFSNLSETEVDSMMYKFMGIKKYILMETLPYDGIHHIDMHMKLLDEKTLIVGKYPDGTADGPQIEANIQYVLSNFQTTFGTPFRVIRVTMPPDVSGYYPDQGGDYRTFANALILNKSVLLPIYEAKYDTTAVNIWQNAMPGYKIRTIDCNSMISASGAIHCITHEIGVQNPLLIQHLSLSDVNGSFPLGYPVDAFIQHKSGIQLATLYYRLEGETVWKSVNMEEKNALTHSFSGFIPEQVNGSIVEYYIEATANTGKVQTKPMTAPDGFYSFKVEFITATNYLHNNSKLGEIYPNPAGAITCIPVSALTIENISICLVDVFGRTVKTIFKGNSTIGDHNYFFDASDLIPGSYIVKYSSENAVSSKVLMIK
ncbi:MAG TPA: agmatine deiminase family protein, partial [Saprospiraceae bacterium]|nr:agmatine deiminase family protein [Saprospiraceae bacterium]